MQRTRRRSTTGPFWLFAFALLLRAAMPFLASASADWQGQAVGDICSVYGVSPESRHHDAPGAPATAPHGGDHCVLNALAALGTGGAPPRLALPRPAVDAEGRFLRAPSPRPDATTAWVARRKQGPPGLA